MQSQAKAIVEKSPEPVKDLLRKGDVSINAAHAISELPAQVQAEVAAKGPEAVKAKAKEVREEKASQNGHRAIPPIVNGEPEADEEEPEDEDDPEFAFEEPESSFVLAPSKPAPPADPSAGFWRRVARVRDELRIILNTALDPDNADLIDNNATSATREANMHSLIGIRDDANDLIKRFRKGAS